MHVHIEVVLIQGHKYILFILGNHRRLDKEADIH